MLNARQTFLKILILVTTGQLGSSCAAIKPYEKELLLDPLMSDEGVLGLSPSLMQATLGRFEHVSGGSATAIGSSCPTCGG